MVAELPRVIGEPRAPLGLVARLDRLEVRGERRLRVDDHVPPAGEVDDEIGAEPALVPVDRRLLLEVAAVEHARELDDAAELHLAPAPAGLRGAERLHEVRRLAADERLRLRDLPELLRERAVRPLPRALDRPQLAVEPAERVADGGEEGRDGLLAAGEVAVGGRALAAERGPGELQERGGGGAERVGGERLERVGEPRPRVLHERALLRGAGSLRGERRLELGDPHRPLGRAPRIAAPGEPAEGGAEREAEREEEESGRVHARKRTLPVCPLRSSTRCSSPQRARREP